MKKAFLILALLFGFAGSAQEKYPESNMPGLSDPILHEFLHEGLKRNAYLERHLNEHLKGIYFLPKYEFKRWIGSTNDGRAGCVAQYHNYLLDQYEPMILIDSAFLDKAETVKAFIWHELGHIFGLEHDQSGDYVIMSEKINGSVMTPYNIELFFRKIKRVPPYNYRSKISLRQ